MQEPNTHPGPLTEIAFWTERAANLNAIHQRLSSERVKKVAKVLELVKSTYYPAFNRQAQLPSVPQQAFCTQIKPAWPQSHVPCSSLAMSVELSM